MTAFAALFKRELIRQIRQPSRIIASVATPAMVWVFLAAGFTSTSVGMDTSMRAFLVPGIASLTVLFASVFGAISLIQDRHDGFLRAALVSPASRLSIAGSKVAAGSLLATLQGLVVLLALPLAGTPITLPALLTAVAVLALISAALIGLGLTLAWRVDSTSGFHGVMNTVLMPLWLLSGAVFPIETAAPWLGTIAKANPLTWAHEAMRHALGMNPQTHPMLAWGITIAAAVGCTAVAAMTIGRTRNDSAARSSRTPTADS